MSAPHSLFLVSLLYNLNTMSKQSVLVTGGGQGLGLAVIKKLLNGTSRTPPTNVFTLTTAVSDEFRELQSQFKDSLACAEGDATKFELSQDAVQQTLDRWKRLDALVLNAGITKLSPIRELVCLPLMKDHGNNDENTERECSSPDQHYPCCSAFAQRTKRPSCFCYKQLFI